jgi:hypothetical protein
VRVSCLSALLLLTACPLFGGPSGDDPCNDDANACGAGGVLEFDASCELEDVLQLELGIGIDNPSQDHLAFEVIL